ncbi:UNVERIFIED_CONTAM: hypothetical protein RMT77_011941 [Armadillidium vulgare]
MKTYSKYFISVFVISLTTSTIGSIVRSRVQYSSSINPGNGLARGDWGPIAECFTNTYAHQMEFKYEPWGQTDATIGNGLKLYCYDTAGNMVSYVTSSEGDNGQWQGIKSCPQNVYINGFAMEVEADKGTFGDDVGVVDIRVICEDGTVLDGLSTTRQLGKIPKIKPVVVERIDKANENLKFSFSDDEKSEYKNKIEEILKKKNKFSSEWGPLATCPSGTKVCGLQTRVDAINLFDDDAGLCDVILYCCQ